MAWSDRPWILEGAAVRVSLIGFDNGDELQKTLDGKTATEIYADLTGTLNLTESRRLHENGSLAFQGTAKVGPFDVNYSTAESMLLAGGNPNGRPNSDVLRSWINGIDITRRPRNMWIIDFGIDMPLEEASLYELPFEYVKQHVKPIRDNVKRQRRRERWWLFGETCPGLRKRIAPLSRYIATPMVAKFRVFVWIASSTIPENLVIAIAREDDYFFGVLHSRFHELWSLRMGTSLEDRPRYTPTTTFETFPFPWPPGTEPADDPRVQAIAAAAADLVQKRDAWLNPPDATEAELKKRTLTNLYNQRPTWLDLAHRRLDAAVAAAYGWPADLADDDILARLLALNLERAKTP